MASNYPTKSLEGLALNKAGIRTVETLPTEKEYLDQKQWKIYTENPASNVRIRRWRYGKESRKTGKLNKTILMVGETGSGKTTLINTLLNHVMGVKFEDKVWYEITEEHQQDTSASQTTYVTVYVIHVEKYPISLTIIDTPGYGDTRGANHDKAVADYLRQLFESYGGIDTINLVGLVIKSSQNRLTEFQHYIFESLLSLFGKDIQENVVILITHSDGLPPTDALKAITNANTRCAKDKDGEPIYYLFNNRQCEPHKKNQAKYYEHFWNLGRDSAQEFLERLRATKEQSLKMTADVLKKRKQLEAYIHELMSTINRVNVEERQLENITKVVRENKEKLDSNESFEYEVEETVVMKVPVSAYFANCTEMAMCCDVCKMNCHFPGCTFVSDLWWCEVMSNGKCKLCGCCYTKHSKEDRLYMPVAERVKKTNQDLKNRYLDVHGKNVDIQRNIERELNETRQRMSELLNKIYDHIIRLDQIALHCGSLNIHVDFDILIEKLAKSNQCGKAEKLMEIKSRASASKDSWRFWKK